MSRECDAFIFFYIFYGRLKLGNHVIERGTKFEIKDFSIDLAFNDTRCLQRYFSKSHFFLNRIFFKNYKMTF